MSDLWLSALHTARLCVVACMNEDAGILATNVAKLSTLVEQLGGQPLKRKRRPRKLQVRFPDGGEKWARMTEDEIEELAKGASSD